MSTQIASYLDDSFDFLDLQKKTEEELNFLPDLDTDTEEENQELCFQFKIEPMTHRGERKEINKKTARFYREDAAESGIKGKKLNF